MLIGGNNVSINGFDSSKLEIKSGVLQESTLDPLLFLLYINDLKYSMKYSTTSHFADDTSIIYASKALKTLESKLNCDLKSVSEWLKLNRLSLNVGKTKLLIFHSKNKSEFNDISIKIEHVKVIPSNYVKYLCVLIDENLSWDHHVKELSNKLSRANGIISKLMLYAPKSAVLSVYHAIFYSHDIWLLCVFSHN